MLLYGIINQSIDDMSLHQISSPYAQSSKSCEADANAVPLEHDDEIEDATGIGDDMPHAGRDACVTPSFDDEA